MAEDGPPPAKARKVAADAAPRSSADEVLQTVLARMGRATNGAPPRQNAAQPAPPAAPAAGRATETPAEADPPDVAAALKAALSTLPPELRAAAGAMAGMPDLGAEMAQVEGEGGGEEEGDPCRSIPADFPPDFVAERDTCVELRLDGLAEPITPEFTHQVFPRDKYLLGYRNLKVVVSYTKLWRVMVQVNFDEALEGASRWGPDFLDRDLPGQVKKSGITPQVDKANSFTTDPEVFARWCEEDRANLEGSFAALGVKTVSLQAVGKLQVIKCVNLHEHAAAKALFSRLQAMSLWWIESSEQTDASDWRWGLYLALENHEIVGFATVFTFVNPVRVEQPHIPRISQVVISPHRQRQGFGRSIVQAIYDEAIADASVYQLTVEDPCPLFVSLRDSIECGLLQCKCDYAPLPAFPRGIVPPEECERIRSLVKVIPRQVQRCFEILRFSALKDSDDAGESAFRVDIKRRMFADNVEDVQNRPRETLKDNLQLLYDDLVDQFKQVKLA